MQWTEGVHSLQKSLNKTEIGYNDLQIVIKQRKEQLSARI